MHECHRVHDVMDIKSYRVDLSVWLRSFLSSGESAKSAKQYVDQWNDEENRS